MMGHGPPLSVVSMAQTHMGSPLLSQDRPFPCLHLAYPRPPPFEYNTESRAIQPTTPDDQVTD
jgi:hypothetical protein